MILLELMKILWGLMMYMGLVLRMIDQNWETNWILLMIPNLQSPEGGINQIYIVELILMYLMKELTLTLKLEALAGEPHEPSHLILLFSNIAVVSKSKPISKSDRHIISP